MRDWRKAWYTYGQCDISTTPEKDIPQTEDESSNEGNGKQSWVVNPFTGEANYEITEVDGSLPEDLVGVLYRNGEKFFIE
jgi:carotenoid cleavage dioxygenase-like enzyme